MTHSKEIKSNNLPSTLTNDENVSVKDKQIEEMAMVVCSKCVVSKRCRFYKKPCSAIKAECEALYNAGYRKQSEGEWIWTENGNADYEKYWVCSNCKEHDFVKSKFCPNCGAKMKGGEE